MAELGRVGAEVTKQVRRKGKGLRPGELPPLRTPQDAERWAEVVGRAVASGSLTHSQGKAISSLIREWRASHDAGTVADHVQELRAEMAKLKGDRKLQRVK